MVSVLVSASVKRFRVSRVRDFFLDNFFKMISRGMSKNNFIFFQVGPIFFLLLLEGGPNFLFFMIFILIGGWKRLE